MYIPKNIKVIFGKIKDVFRKIKDIFIFIKYAKKQR